MDTANVLNRLDKFCGARGIPDRIISDRGTCFTVKAFKIFCDTRGIKHTLNSIRHPQANGQVERANRTIVPLLSIMIEDQVHWDDKVQEMERHLNSAVNKTSEKSYFEALHGSRQAPWEVSGKPVMLGYLRMKFKCISVTQLPPDRTA